MDNATRTMLAYRVSKRQSCVRSQSLFGAAYNFARRTPQILVSDGLKSFTGATDSVFTDAKSRTFVHIREIHLGLQYNNNDIQEMLNGEITDRLRNIRESKSEIPRILRLYVVYRNFFRPHLSLNNEIPFSAAGVTMGGERRLDWDTRYLPYKTRKYKSRSKSKNSDKQKIKLRHVPVHDYDLPAY